MFQPVKTNNITLNGLNVYKYSLVSGTNFIKDVGDQNCCILRTNTSNLYQSTKINSPEMTCKELIRSVNKTQKGQQTETAQEELLCPFKVSTEPV